MFIPANFIPRSCFTDMINYKTIFVLLTICLFSVSANAMVDTYKKPAASSNKASSYLLLDIANAGENLIAVGAKGHILISKNKGLDWEQVQVPTSVLLTAVHFPSPNKGWAVGHGGIILHSSNGGISWERQLDGYDVNQTQLSQKEANVKQLEHALKYANDSERDEIEFELEDAQYALEDALADAEIGPTKPFLDVYFLNDKEGYAIGAYGLFFKTTDAGKTWLNESHNLDNYDQWHLNAIQGIDQNTILITGEAGVLFRSENSGNSWESIESPTENSLYGLVSNDKVVLAFGVKGELIISKNAGVSWEKIDTGTTHNLYGASINRSGHISIVGHSGTVLHSQNHGKSFSVKTRKGQLSYTSSLSIGNDRILASSEAGVSQMSASGGNISGFSENISSVDHNYFATIGNYAISDNVMALYVKTAEEECASYPVMEMIDRIQWQLENTKGVKSTASVVTVSKHITMALNEGHFKWFELSLNDAIINSSIQREPGLINGACSVSPILVFLDDTKPETVKEIAKVMNQLAKQYATKAYRIEVGQETNGVAVFNKLNSSEKLGGYITLDVSVNGGDIFTKSYMDTLRKLTKQVLSLPSVDYERVKSLWTKNLTWLEVTEDGFVGGPVIPENFNGSKNAIVKLQQNIIKSGQIGHMVSEDLKSTSIFIPYYAVDKSSYKKFNYRNRFRELAKTLNQNVDISNIEVKIDGIDLSLIF